MKSIDVGTAVEADRALLQAAVNLIIARRHSEARNLLEKNTPPEEQKDALECAELLGDYMSTAGTVRDDVPYRLRLGSQVAYLEKRDAHTQPLLRNLVYPVYPTDPLKAVPAGRVAMCFSGGGYRAMIGTAAFVNACKRLGLLDCISYIAGLSGSSWALGPWYTSKNNPFVEPPPVPLSRIHGAVLHSRMLL